MPHLGDTLEEAEANDCAADCAADDATCCVPVRGAAGSAAATAGKKIPALSVAGAIRETFALFAKKRRRQP